jgi:glc operon protein GlcG
MRRLAFLSIICVAFMTSTPALAQVPPDPSNPNETIPDAMTQPQYGEPINTETAKKAAAGAIAEAKKRNWNGLCVAVVGPSGDLVYFEKQDNCQFASISISQHKARTAARYRARRWCWSGCSPRAISSAI